MIDCDSSDCDLSFKTSTNSTNSSMSNDSYTRLNSFELLTASSSPENLTLKPHRSSDFSYSATFRRSSGRGLTLSDFRLIRHIGSGDIGTVYLCRLTGKREGDEVIADDENKCWVYAMKVVDKEALLVKNKVHRAEIERKILKMLDHPFLPTLHAEFETSNFSCIVMEYCSGGDLHSLRHNQPLKRFSVSSARFYAAEVLVALEYLHMLGIIYRDLKPENVLVRSDGHIMLSDFDLSLCSDATPAVESPSLSPPSSLSYTRSHSSKTFPCLLNRLFRSKKIQTLSPDRLFIAEPVSARSCSFVGTHEYVAPEVASGGPHGNAVDWWALGIFIYELIYGRTPFAAPSNEHTLRNITKQPLSFPAYSPSSSLELHARDLISELLHKDPNSRLGSKRGSADVKTHPFFEGLNFALIRTVQPPQVPGPRRSRRTASFNQRNKKSTAFDYF